MARSVRGSSDQLLAFATRRLSRFGGLSAEEEQGLRSQVANAAEMPAGAELIGEGIVLPKPHLVLTGWCAAQRMTSDGRRQIFEFLLPGDVFGVAARPLHNAAFSTIALTGAVVAPLQLDFDVPADLVWQEAGPDGGALTRAAWAAVRRREHCLLNQVVRLGCQTAYERTAHLLLELHDRLAAVGLADGMSYHMPLTQDVLSDALGLSVVHMNRTLQQMRRDGLIEIDHMTVTLRQHLLMATLSDWESFEREENSAYPGGWPNAANVNTLPQ